MYRTTSNQTQFDTTLLTVLKGNVIELLSSIRYSVCVSMRVCACNMYETKLNNQLFENMEIVGRGIA